MTTQIRDRAVTAVCRLLAALFGAGRRLGARRVRSPNRILVLKPCCLGDVLMATPVLAALRRGYPAVHIAFAVGGWSRGVLANNPNLDELVDCGAVGSGRYGIREFLALARRLRRGHFDLALVLDRSPALGILAWLAGIPQRVGLNSGGRGFAHTVPVTVDWRRPKHEAELYLDCVRALGLAVTEPRLQYFPTDADRALAERLLAGPGPWVAIHPGGAANPGMTLLSKRWAPERFAAIGDRLVETYRAHIVLVGASGDAEAVDAVRRAMHHRPLLLVGKTTLGELAALYERCMLMLGNDSGVMHLAVAVGTPVVAVFGPSDPRVYGPYGPGNAAVRHDAQCAGRCFVPGRGIAVRCDRRCIEGVTVEAVWQAVETVLGKVVAHAE